MATLVTEITATYNGSILFHVEQRAPVPELFSIPFPPSIGLTLPAIPFKVKIPSLNIDGFSFSFIVPAFSLPSIPFPPPIGITLPAIPFKVKIPSLDIDGVSFNFLIPAFSIPGIPFPPPIGITLPDIFALLTGMNITLPALPDATITVDVRIE